MLAVYGRHGVDCEVWGGDLTCFFYFEYENVDSHVKFVKKL